MNFPFNRIRDQRAGVTKSRQIQRDITLLTMDLTPFYVVFGSYSHLKTSQLWSQAACLSLKLPWDFFMRFSDTHVSPIFNQMHRRPAVCRKRAICSNQLQKMRRLRRGRCCRKGSEAEEVYLVQNDAEKKRSVLYWNQEPLILLPS